MSPARLKAFIAAALFFISLIILFYHRSTSPIEIGRPVSLFQKADASGTIKLRKDFASFYYACKAVTLHKNLYNTFTLNEISSTDSIQNGILPYLYPPFFAILLQPLGTLPPLEAQAVWDRVQIMFAALTVVFVYLTLGASVTSLHPSEKSIVGGALLALFVFIFPMRENIDYGQINIPVVFLLSLMFYLSFARKQDLAAGIVLSLAVLFKVTPLLLVIFFLVNKQWKVLLGACTGVMLFVLLSVIAAGVTPWVQFMEFLPAMGYAKAVDGGFLPNVISNFSLAGFLMRVFVGNATLVRFLTMIGGVLLVALLLYHHIQFRTEGNTALLVLPYLVLMIILSPVAWYLHLVYLLPGAAFVFYELLLVWSARKWDLVTGYVLLMLAIANYQPAYAKFHIPEVVRPFLTSLNLFFLLGLFAFNLSILRKRSRAF